jgi:alcohol dehydrogenase YqhD (iron-dependent ADH family)
MENFTAFNPTTVHFGRGVTDKLGEIAKTYGKKALLMYGKGSVIRNGSYQNVKNQLEIQGIGIIEYNGIKSNPLVDDVDKAAKLAIEFGADMIIAVGGGSVADSAKITAICISDGAKAWDVMKGKHIPNAAVPLIVVLTLAATGTEMNATSVLQNTETREKIGFRHPVMYPAHSFLDPEYTCSVPSNYTSYGIVDLIAHCLEAYFGEGNASLSDRFVESIIKEAMKYGPELMNDLENYDLRARIMWAATNALNGLTGYGRVSGDWGVHALGHVLSFLYDTPHGASLSIVYPAWMKKIKERDPERIAQLGLQLFGLKDAENTIKEIEKFFSRLGSPVRLEEAGITDNKKEEILELMNRNNSSGIYYILSNKDRKDIVELMGA